MSGGARVRVRGVYATALSALLLEQGAIIVDPSLPIQERLGIPYIQGPEEVAIFDRQDRQGVIVEGVSGSVTWIIGTLTEALPHSLFRHYNGDAGISREVAENGLQSLRSALVGYVAEFPATVKWQLDHIRSLKAPTIPGHHCLKEVDPEAVDEAELELMGHPDQRKHYYCAGVESA